jgi:hypothetical protein
VAESITITRETFDQWSLALEEQAENDDTSETVRYPDGGTTMTARPTLGMLHRFPGDQILTVEVGQTRNLWPKYASVARSDTVTLRDPSEDGTPERRHQNFRNLIRNAERLTGISAQFVE